MISHDSRRVRGVTSLLCILAASLSSNHNVGVDAFGIASNTRPAATKSRSALDISTTIPHSQPSLADRFFEEVTSAVNLQQNKNKKKRSNLKKTASAASITSSTTAASSTDYSQQQQQSQSHVSSFPLDEQEVLKRKLEWAGRYTTVEALRETFGGNENRLWGDLQASTARRLYKTLLPRALLELSQLGVGQLQPQDLAPLAYQARVAAKLYARERCTVPARIGATLFDGFRQWIKYGKFQAHGMTYDQLWQKYSEKICQETESPGEEDVCLKILERSCVSNEGVDNLVLNRRGNSKAKNAEMEQQQQQLVERIHAQLEQDMYELLLPKNVVVRQSSSTPKHRQQRKRPWSKRNHVMMVRLLARQRRMMQKREQKQDEQDVLRP